MPTSEFYARVLMLAGTRPEALKLAPVARALGPAVAAGCWTGQQTEIPADAVDWQRLAAPAHPLRRAALEAALTASISEAIKRTRPRAVLVQGDTATAFAGARAARASKTPLIHLEAGLRSGDLRAPFPEEAYRRAIAPLADLHLTPNARAAAQLRHEGIAASHIVVVGSTAVDGLRQAPRPAVERFDLLVDVHRRENARRLARLALALRVLVRSGWRIGLVAHPNQQWTRRWDLALGPNAGVQRLPALSRDAWLALVRAARGVLCDSGGAAEELPYLGVPLLVYRHRTERLEPLESGHARLLDPRLDQDLASAIERHLACPHWPQAWPLSNNSPYGDGRAGSRAAAAIRQWLANTPAP